MREFLETLRGLGYEPPSVTLDGKVHRFDRKGKLNAWLIGWQNHGLKDGKVYVVAQFGDFKTGERHTYKPAKLSTADNEAVKKQIELAQSKAAEDKRLRQIEASEKAAKYWASSKLVGVTPYMERKLIPELYGARLYNDTVQIPIVDIDGKLWGLQYVKPDGTKRWLTGTRVEGNFHLMGGPLEGVAEAYLCEGFATGASIHQAMGRPVILAFNAGNLVAVAKVVKERYPDLLVTVCGDDDRFREDGKNPGVEKAQKAALILQGSCVIPRFVSEEGKPTDFNDLHAREGLDALRDQLGAPPEVEAKFLPMGYDEGTYFFYEQRSRDIVKISSFSQNALLQLAPLDYWLARYETAKGGADWIRAIDDMTNFSRRVGPFDSSRIRGTGVWSDDGRVVLNTGHTIITGGREVTIASLRSWRIYVQTRNRLPPLDPTPLTGAEGKMITDACLGLKWTDPKSPFLLAGWLAVARIAGSLSIRPHVWLTGGKGTGKTTLFDRVITPCLGAHKGRLHFQGGTTEAGIRQSIKASAVPVIFDECEVNTPASKARVDAIIELCRNTWSETQGHVAKGSTSGCAQEFQLAFAACLSSIRVNLTNDADRSRFSVLELAPHGSDLDHWRLLEERLAEIDDTVGERLFARMVGMVPQVRAAMKTFSRVLAQQISQRYGQQVGTLLAGWWCLEHDEVLTDEAARRAIAELDLADEKDEESLTDEWECLNHLLTWKLTIRDSFGTTRDKTVGLIIEGNNKEEWECLKNYGVLVKPDVIFIPNNHSELTKIYSTTRWVSWTRSLMRIKGAQKPSKPEWLQKARRGVEIPRSSLPL